MSGIEDERLRAAMEEGAGADRGVPDGFTDRVMAAVEERAEAAAEPAGGAEPSAAGGLWERLTRPRTLTWRPVQALAAALVAAVAGTLLFVGGPSGSGGEGAVDGPGAGEPVSVAADVPPGADTVLVRFVYEAPSASSVAVAGDFTRWDPVPLERHVRNGRLLWTGVLAVPRGEHEYMFVVDGEEWVTDPLAPAVAEDGFGHRNAVLAL